MIAPTRRGLHIGRGFPARNGRAFAVPKRLLVAVNDPPLTIDRQAFGGDGRGGHRGT